MNVKQAVPFFAVVNIETSVRYYVDGLGFLMTRQWIADGQLRWCWLALEGAALMLQEIHQKGHGSWTPQGKLGEGVTISFQCEDALALFHEFTRRGILVSNPFVGNGMWVISLADPDGYKLEFESPTDAPEETEYFVQESIGPDPMTAVISLKTVVDSFDTVSRDVRVYLNKNTGETRVIIENELLTLGQDQDEEEDGEDLPEWQRAYRQETEEVLESEEWLPLPDAFTIHEYRIMKDFCYTVPARRLRDELLDKIHGSGAFRRFQATIHRRGLEEDWFAFKRKALVEMAIDWLEKNGLEYVRDEGQVQE